MNIWTQIYDPLQNPAFSTAAAAVPAVALLSCIGIFRLRVHLSAFIGLVIALLIATLIYRMPVDAALASGFYGAGFGLFPIGWIILNIVFLYQLTVKRGHFEILRGSLVSIAPDPRIQVILIAYAGSDASSNVLFGSLQKITAQQIGIDPALMCAANTSGGVMGKMVAAQSIVVVSTATNWYGHEGDILRRVFLHSIALVFLMGGLVYLQAYVFPFTWLVDSLR